MKIFRSVIIYFISASAFAQQTIMVDPHFSPYSGSSNLLFAQELLIQGEDAMFNKCSKENSRAKVWGRTTELMLFWLVVNGYADVTQHEVFGHGYRLRELGYTPRKYEIKPFSGATYFTPHEIPGMTIGELLAITVAGLEAEDILARDLKMHWIAEGEIDGRLGFCYAMAQQSLFWYTLDTHIGKIKGDFPSGSDIQSYMFYHNHSYPDGRLTHKNLLIWASFNWLDPMTFYAYHAVGQYASKGKPFTFPMFTLGEDLRYLPNVKIGYAPYAPEAYLENFFLHKGNPLYFYFKGGKRSFGLGIAYDHLYQNKRGSLGFRFDGWNQSAFNTSTTLLDLCVTGTAYHPSLNKRHWGAALSLTGKLNLFSKLALYSELGGKTSGYLPGYSLDSAITARIGLTFGQTSLYQKPTAETTMHTLSKTQNVPAQDVAN